MYGVFMMNILNYCREIVLFYVCHNILFFMSPIYGHTSWKFKSLSPAAECVSYWLVDATPGAKLLKPNAKTLVVVTAK